MKNHFIMCIFYLFIGPVILLWQILRLYFSLRKMSFFFKGSFISETFDNFDHLNHHWPKILANLNFNLREICPPKREFKLAGILGQWWFKWSKLSKVSEIKLPLKKLDGIHRNLEKTLKSNLLLSLHEPTMRFCQFLHDCLVLPYIFVIKCLL